jgi:hypothetical protein
MSREAMRSDHAIALIIINSLPNSPPSSSLSVHLSLLPILPLHWKTPFSFHPLSVHLSLLPILPLHFLCISLTQKLRFHSIHWESTICIRITGSTLRYTIEERERERTLADRHTHHRRPTRCMSHQSLTVSKHQARAQGDDWTPWRVRGCESRIKGVQVQHGKGNDSGGCKESGRCNHIGCQGGQVIFLILIVISIDVFLE